VKRTLFAARCDTYFRQRKPINNPVEYFSPAIYSSKFQSIRGVGNVGGGTSHDAVIVNGMKRRLTTMLSIISKLSSFHTTLYFTYTTFIHISFSHSFHFFILITCLIFKSWQDAAALLFLLLLFLPAPGEVDFLSTTRIWTMISARYPTIPMIVTMTIQNLMTSHFGEHPGHKWPRGHRKIHSRQHLENESRQLNQLLCQRYPYILSVGRSILSQRRKMKASLHRCRPRRYLIKRLNDSIRPLMYILKRGGIETQAVGNWLNGKLEICGDISPLLMMW